MRGIQPKADRRTTTDIVFDHLFDSIVALEMLPGAKLSEADIARQFGVSRQPVRDAFNKLEAQGLLLIRPQKATKVRGFSMERIAHARFVRLAVELEVLRAACKAWRPEYAAKIAENIQAQERAIEQDQTEEFHRLDYAFHRLICESGGHRLAFETIQECKGKIDRLCVLSLGRASEAKTLLQDHKRLAEALDARDPSTACEVIRTHLSRLDKTIEEVHLKHAEYFE